MNIDEYKEKDISDSDSILDFVNSIKSQSTELVLSSKGNTVGAILNVDQYNWFLDQLDAQQDVEKIHNRASDMKGSQSLSEFKKELDK